MLLPLARGSGCNSVSSGGASSSRCSAARRHTAKVLGLTIPETLQVRVEQQHVCQCGQLLNHLVHLLTTVDVFPPQSGKIQLIFLNECYLGTLEGRHETSCDCVRCGCGSALLTCVEPGGSGGQFRSGSLRWLGSGHAVWDSGGESAAGLLRGTPTTYVHSKLLLDARQPGVGWIPLAQAAHSGVRLNRAGRRNRKAQLGRRAAGRAPVSESRDLLDCQKKQAAGTGRRGKQILPVDGLDLLPPIALPGHSASRSRSSAVIACKEQWGKAPFRGPRSAVAAGDLRRAKG